MEKVTKEKPTDIQKGKPKKVNIDLGVLKQEILKHGGKAVATMAEHTAFQQQVELIFSSVVKLQSDLQKFMPENGVKEKPPVPHIDSPRKRVEGKG